MAKDTRFQAKKEQKISAIQPTDERMTGRAGLALFEAYIRSIQILPLIDRWFGSMRKNSKGLAITELFVQLFCFFMDGTSRHITWFDHLKADEGYAGVIGSSNLASSHTIKRLFSKFSFVRGYLFRRLLQHLFIWRLKITKPKVIMLGMDTMVLDNDDALKRHGVQPTYKKVKGFHPLQLNWGRFFVDAVFRGGKKHSNHSDTADSMLVYIVEKIRKEYRPDVPIIVRMDAGFYDHELFEIMEYLKIGYYCGGKHYKNVMNAAGLATDWQTFSSKDKREIWEYTEFKTRQGGWHKARRTIYSRLIQHGTQLALPGLVKDSIIITNLGMGGQLDEQIRKAGQEHLLSAHNILAEYHQRGADELANRALKNFGHEQLPFKRFAANTAWYYLMCVSHNLFEAFKEDVSAPVISVSVYADTIRRQLIDTAGKIVRHAGKLIMKVPRATFERLQLDRLFAACQNAPAMTG